MQYAVISTTPVRGLSHLQLGLTFDAWQHQNVDSSPRWYSRNGVQKNGARSTRAAASVFHKDSGCYAPFESNTLAFLNSRIHREGDPYTSDYGQCALSARLFGRNEPLPFASWSVTKLRPSPMIHWLASLPFEIAHQERLQIACLPVTGSLNSAMPFRSLRTFEFLFCLYTLLRARATCGKLVKPVENRVCPNKDAGKNNSK
jgi:hypothetical protein